MFWDQIFAIELPINASPKLTTTTTVAAAAGSDGGGDAAGFGRGLVFFRADSWERRVEWVMALSTLSVARTLALEEAEGGEGGDTRATSGSMSMSMTPTKVN